MEEADERIFVHVKHGSRKHARIMIKTVESDVVLKPIDKFHKLVPLNEFWIEFGPRKSLRFIPIHQIARSLVSDKSLWHFCFSMDLVGVTRRHHYQGKARKVFWQVDSDKITPLLKKLSSTATPDEISDDEFELLEFFVVRLYPKTCNTKENSEASRILFSRDNKVIENIPPTKEALRQHVLRSVL